MIGRLVRWLLRQQAYYDAEVAAYRKAATSDAVEFGPRVFTDAREIELLPDTRRRILERWARAEAIIATTRTQEMPRVLQIRKVGNA